MFRVKTDLFLLLCVRSSVHVVKTRVSNLQECQLLVFTEGFFSHNRIWTSKPRMSACTEYSSDTSAHFFKLKICKP